jgi:hypothetical protein
MTTNMVMPGAYVIGCLDEPPTLCKSAAVDTAIINKLVGYIDKDSLKTDSSTRSTTNSEYYETEERYIAMRAEASPDDAAIMPAERKEANGRNSTSL